ncbi:hypothetical protein IE53DRAFT_386269 [Violaceomyces palustris]|uniref:Uncharacterized protein n=1 Tax=Violaceomyces palustris TaxID=1673888 RepID=A0ACD0P0A3_9BASI|nr:hypothetical protein IE53DRAFT_386269 [Violaceomyces palustris]
MATTLKVALHSLGLASCYYGFSSIELISQITGNDLFLLYGGRYQFLTLCGLYLTGLTLVLALLNDLLPTIPALKSIKTFLLGFVMPAEVLITFLYWGLRALDPSLLVPPRDVYDPLDPTRVLRQEVILIPLFMDATLHAFPGLFLLADFLLFSEPFKSIRRTGLSCIAFTIAYSLWVEKCASVNQRFPYPLLDLLSAPQRAALYLTCGVIVSLVLPGCEAAHRALNRSEKTIRSSKKRL